MSGVRLKGERGDHEELWRKYFSGKFQSENTAGLAEESAEYGVNDKLVPQGQPIPVEQASGFLTPNFEV